MKSDLSVIHKGVLESMGGFVQLMDVALSSVCVFSFVICLVLVLFGGGAQAE